MHGGDFSVLGKTPNQQKIYLEQECWIGTVGSHKAKFIICQRRPKETDHKNGQYSARLCGNVHRLDYGQANINNALWKRLFCQTGQYWPVCNEQIDNYAEIAAKSRLGRDKFHFAELRSFCTKYKTFDDGHTISFTSASWNDRIFPSAAKSRLRREKVHCAALRSVCEVGIRFHS